MRFVSFLSLIMLSIALFPTASFAVSDQERIDQLERDVLILQRKLARTGDASSAPVDDVTGVGGGQVDNRMTALEEEIRSLRGKIEEKDFETKQLAEQLELFKRDVELRLSDMEKGAGASGTVTKTTAAAEPAKPAPQTPTPAQTTANTPAQHTLPPAEAAPKPAPKMELSVKDATPQLGAPVAATEGNFESPRDHYNYAFRLLNQNQHDEAAKSFTAFIAKNPKDPLVGNAYYWLGETYYIRGDYAQATDKFRQGFEAMPKGPKAADNLLKLAMSLGRENKNKEACIVLAQVMDKYKTTSPNTANKAASEHKRLSCE